MDKAPDAFRTISEVADEIDVPQHVLRFWESRFAQIRPMKRGGGRRYYRPDDVDLLRGVRHLLYGEGYTIRGVQRILREEGATFVQNVWRAGALQPAPESADDEESTAAAASAGTGDARPEPKLASFGAASVPHQDTDGRADRDRRTAKSQSPAVPAAAPPQAGMAAEQRRRLQGAVDELVECRRLIEAAWTGDAEPDL